MTPIADVLVLDSVLSRKVCKQIRADVPPDWAYLEIDESPHRKAIQKVIENVRKSCPDAPDEVSAGLIRTAKQGLGHHRDSGNGTVVVCGRQVQVVYAAVVYLNDPDDYEGGDLVIAGGERLRPSRGSVVVIPGDVLHRVTPTTGTRCVLKLSFVVPVDA